MSTRFWWMSILAWLTALGGISCGGGGGNGEDAGDAEAGEMDAEGYGDGTDVPEGQDGQDPGEEEGPPPGPLCEPSTYYVDFDDGNDDNAGICSDQAWKHAPGDENAAGVPAGVTLVPGNVVRFKGGVLYRGSISMPASGSEGQPIVCDGNSDGWWGSGRAVLDGSEVLSGWERCASAEECGGLAVWEQLYRVAVPAALREEADPLIANLHEDDTMLAVAQEPNQPDTFFIDDIEYFWSVPVGQATSTSLTDPVNLDQTDEHAWDDSYVLIWVYHNIVDFRKILTFVPAENRITFDETSNPPYDDRETRYSLYNGPPLLDRAGEYTVTGIAEGSDRTIILWPAGGTGLEDRTVTISVRHFGVDINGQSYVTLQGFLVQKYHGSGLTDAIGLGSVTLRYVTVTGIVIRNNVTRRNRHGEGGYGGISLSGCSDCLVEGNLVDENPRNAGIFCTDSEHLTVRGNTVSRPGQTAIRFYGVVDGRMLDNTVIHSTGGHANGLTLYLSCDRVLVAGNRVLDSDSPLTFQDSSNLTFYNNLIDSYDRESNVNEWSGESSGNIVLMNNTFVNNSRNAALNLSNDPDAHYVVVNNIIDGYCPDTSVTELSHNLYTGLAWCQDEGYGWTLEEGGIIQEEMAAVFVDPAAADYHLCDGSPAVDAGVDVTSFLPVADFPDYNFAADTEGAARPQGAGWDIGAYERAP
jgi:parallel beta-helix repeat protein